MHSATYLDKRSQLETYFDRTAVDAWEKLTSDAPLSGVRATVRAGRNSMRALLLDWLPQDLSGRRILDAGCGAGQFAVEAARRGADVVAVDLSPTLLDLAQRRYADADLSGTIEFRSGDMFDPALGRFDHVVAMDSLIHYEADDMLRVLEGFKARTRHSVLFTFAPSSPLLGLMHAVGKAFPRSDRAPAIAPVAERLLRARIDNGPAFASWRLARTEQVKSGFYISCAAEIAAA